MHLNMLNLANVICRQQLFAQYKLNYFHGAIRIMAPTADIIVNTKSATQIAAKSGRSENAK